MDYEFEIRRHAFVRAMERGIDPDMIEATLNGGAIERFGKNYMRFSRPYKDFKVICIGERCGLMIRIITIERGEK
jgi:hypothetical protein